MKTKVLIVGDSMVKYLKEYYFHAANYEVDLMACPGSTIERLTRKLSFRKDLYLYDIILVHVGTNNLNDDVEVYFQKYNDLFKQIFHGNPTTTILVSPIIPRAPDFYTSKDERFHAAHTLFVTNQKFAIVNNNLSEYCCAREAILFCRYEESWRKYIGYDGVHLSRCGNQKLAVLFNKWISSCIAKKLVSVKKKMPSEPPLPILEIPESPVVSGPSEKIAPSELTPVLDLPQPTFDKALYSDVLRLGLGSASACKRKITSPKPTPSSLIQRFIPGVKITTLIVTSKKVVPPKLSMPTPKFPKSSVTRLSEKIAPSEPTQVLDVPGPTSDKALYSDVLYSGLESSTPSFVQHFVPSVKITPLSVTDEKVAPKSVSILVEPCFTSNIKPATVTIPRKKVVSSKHKKSRECLQVDISSEKITESKISKNNCSLDKLVSNASTQTVMSFPISSDGYFPKLITNGVSTNTDNSDILHFGISKMHCTLKNVSLIDSKCKSGQLINGGGGIEINRSIYPRSCDVCLKTFKTKSSFCNHKKVCKTRSIFPKLCDICFKFYKSRKSFNNHKKKCVEGHTPTKKIDTEVLKEHKNSNENCHTTKDLCQHRELCPEIEDNLSFNVSDCKQSPCSVQKGNKHLSKNYDSSNVKKFTFDSVTHFQNWLELEGTSTFSSFKKITGSKIINSITYHYYSCQFGVRFLQKRRSSSRRNKKGTIPTSINCPVRIFAREDNNKVDVLYSHNHNHHVGVENFKYQPIKLNYRSLIKTYLRLSVPPQKIKEILQDGFGCRNNDNTFPFKEGFLSRGIIKAYDRRMQRALHPENDATSVFSQYERLKNETYNSVLIYKPQGDKTLYGPKELDDLPNSNISFAFGFQTERQKNMMIQGCREILCIDSTHQTNQYDFYLVNLVVPDEYGNGYPIAHFITNFLDSETMACLFRSIKHRIPDLNVNCIMTDDDKATYFAFARVFGPEVKHLLCMWHVDQAWGRQLRCKISDKKLRDIIMLKLKGLLREKNSIEFDSQLNEFLSTGCTKSNEFIAYFSEHYCNRIDLWAMSYRKFPHASTETNMYCESFHNKLKTVYLGRERNRRIDKLIFILLEMEKDAYLTHRFKLLIGAPIRNSVISIERRHNKGLKICDNDVTVISRNIWSVCSQSQKNQVYIVEKNHHACRHEHCFYRCMEISCTQLCSHLYDCNCPDQSAFCKHIHKVHALTNKKENISKSFCSDENSSISLENMDEQLIHRKKYNPYSAKQKIKVCEGSSLKLMQLIKIPTVQNIMLRNVETTLNSLVAECEGVAMNNKCLRPEFKLSSCIAPNQKVVPQVNFFRTTKKRKFGKVQYENKVGEKCLVGEAHIDDFDVDNPSAMLSPPSKRQKVDNLQEVFNTNMVLQAPNSNIQIGNYDISPVALKSLDPHITEAEEKILKSKATDFVKGWIFDTIVNAFLYKLCEDNEDYCFIDSSISQLVCHGIFNESSLPVFKESSKYTFIPICLNSHWILIIIQQEQKIMEFYDPLKNSDFSKYESVIYKWIQALNNIFNVTTEWQIKCPPHVLQADSSNCGIFVCYYAYQHQKQLSLTQNFNALRFRKYIFSALIDHRKVGMPSFVPMDLDDMSQKRFNYSRFEKIDINNASSLEVKIDQFEIRTYMLKSLDPEISHEEELILKSISPCFNKGWLYDDIIDAFFFKILNNNKNFMLALSFYSTNIYKNNVLKKVWTKENLDSARLIFIPANLYHHWVLIVADLENKAFEFYNPLSKTCSNDYQVLINKWHGILNDLMETTNKWQISCPPHIDQVDNYNCGVFICYYAYQKINNLDLTLPFDKNEFRRLIYSYLVER